MKTECGKVIAANRKRLGLTQAELGAQLNVTAQAVSKWENGISEPDFATLQRLTELFGISAEEFFGGGKKEAAQEAPSEEASAPSAEQEAAAAAAEPETVAATAQQAPPAPTVIVGYCEACRKPIEQNSDYHVYPARRGRPQRIVCATCFQREEASRRQADYEKEKEVFRRSMIIATLIALFVVIGGVAVAISEHDPIYLIFIAIAAALFMFVSQCFWTSYALDLLLFFCHSFRLPGLIFTLDLDGIIWFILVKLLFGILTAFLSCLLFCVGLLISMAVGVVTFPFCFPSEIKKLKEMKRSIS